VSCHRRAGGNGPRDGLVDHRVHGHFNWVRIFARITPSVVLAALRRTAALAGLNARRHHLARWVAVRRDLDILQADPRVGVTIVVWVDCLSRRWWRWWYLGHIQIINLISTQFSMCEIRLRDMGVDGHGGGY
jgi:hypothetical protein